MTTPAAPSPTSNTQQATTQRRDSELLVRAASRPTPTGSGGATHRMSLLQGSEVRSAHFVAVAVGIDKSRRDGDGDMTMTSITATRN